MSVVAVSSYFLWTQKGFTRLPLVRGSGFVVAFAQQHAFYRYHVVTAAHVACPVRYRQLYGNSVGLRAIGERHVTCRLLTSNGDNRGGTQTTTHRITTSLDLLPAPACYVMPTVDVVALRCAREEALRASAVRPLELAPCTLAPGTRLRFCGVVTREDRANPTDDAAELHACTLYGTCKAALVTSDYGTVFVATLDAPARGDRDDAEAATGTATGTVTSAGDGLSLPLSMCGGAVLREGDDKCVGVIVARVRTAKPLPQQKDKAATSTTDDAQRDGSNSSSNASSPLYRDPCLDLSEHAAMRALGALDVAFVPVVEFYNALRRCEL